MIWLHNFFGLFFIPAASRAKSAQQLISTVLPFHPLYFPWEGVKNPANSGDDSNLCEIHNNLVAQCACFGSIVQPELYFFFEKLDHHYFNHYHLLFLSYIIWECAIKFLQQNLHPMRLQKYDSMLWPKKGAHIFLCDLLFGPSINYGLYLTNTTVLAPL